MRIEYITWAIRKNFMSHTGRKIFLNRNQDARIYPVPRDQGMPEGVVIEVGNQGVAYEHARGGRVSNL